METFYPFDVFHFTIIIKENVKYSVSITIEQKSPVKRKKRNGEQKKGFGSRFFLKATRGSQK